MPTHLESLATSISQLLVAQQRKLVLAESCTAGLAAHSLSRIPGASGWLCGSAVVYRNETKTAWLGVASGQLADPSVGPVSRQVAAAMCRGVLLITPEADLAAAITGHLGPQAPDDLDGQIHIGLQCRTSDEAVVLSRRLTNRLPAGVAADSLRQYRQQLAATEMLVGILASLSGQAIATV